MLGGMTVLLSLVLIIYALISWVTGHVVAGWASFFVGTMLFGGIQLISLGVIGEYVGKIYIETKSRPRYIVEERLGRTEDVTEHRQNKGNESL